MIASPVFTGLVTYYIEGAQEDRHHLDDFATAACVCSARKLVFIFATVGEDPGRYFTYFGARGFISVAIVARTCQVHRTRSHDERADGNIEQVQGAARSR